jgi:starvation-inducible DNA-binding protein
LDEIVQDVRNATDEVAERITTLATWADGRAETITTGTTLSSFPEGKQGVEECVELIADRLASAVQTVRQAIEPMGELDPVTEDLLIGICGKLEKHLWMVQAQHAQEDRP